jgi:hypothetical protein
VKSFAILAAILVTDLFVLSELSHANCAANPVMLMFSAMAS